MFTEVTNVYGQIKGLDKDENEDKQSCCVSFLQTGQSREKIYNFVPENGSYFVLRASSNHEILLIHHFRLHLSFVCYKNPWKGK